MPLGTVLSADWYKLVHEDDLTLTYKALEVRPFGLSGAPN